MKTVRSMQMINRIIKLTYLLSIGKSINVLNFADKEKVSKRTIKRDILKIGKVIDLESFRENDNTVSFCHLNFLNIHLKRLKKDLK